MFKNNWVMKKKLKLSYRPLEPFQSNPGKKKMDSKVVLVYGFAWVNIFILSNCKVKFNA